LRQLKAHARLAHQLGIPTQNTFIVENGYVIEFDDGEGRIGERVPGGYVYVDGSTVGDISPEVLRDREVLSRDGFVVAIVQRDSDTGQAQGRPEIITRGFVVEHEAQDLIVGAEDAVLKAVQGGAPNGAPSGGGKGLRDKVKDALTEYLYHETKRRPMVIPVVLE
jgi:ribonuclease J